MSESLPTGPDWEELSEQMHADILRRINVWEPFDGNDCWFGLRQRSDGMGYEIGSETSEVKALLVSPGVPVCDQSFSTVSRSGWRMTYWGAENGSCMGGSYLIEPVDISTVIALGNLIKDPEALSWINFRLTDSLNVLDIMAKESVVAEKERDELLGHVATLHKQHPYLRG